MKKTGIGWAERNAFAALGLFFFVFLETEYLFDGRMALFMDSAGVVRAQNVILGRSALGFFCYSRLRKLLKKKEWKAGRGFLTGGSMAGGLCFLLLWLKKSIVLMLLAGIVLFFLLGLIGSLVHGEAARELSVRKRLAGYVGISYGSGIFLQFLVHNLLARPVLEAAAVLAGGAVLTGFAGGLLRDRRLGTVLPMAENEKSLETECGKALDVSGMKQATFLFLLLVVFMTCIFATLDNAVTLAHAAGTADIGQWPRLLLVASAVAAGFLFDLWERKLMHIIMYCVTLLSTICVLVIEAGGSFVMGLLVFYLAAGFFSVYFTAGFMELSWERKDIYLWAGMGRAVNNLCAIFITFFSVWMLESGNAIGMIVTALLLFVLISMTMYGFLMEKNKAALRSEGIGREKGEQAAGDAVREDEITKPEDGEVCESGEKENTGAENAISEKCGGRKNLWPNRETLLAMFSREYQLTDREKEVLEALLTSDESMQQVAEQLAFSRAALYRHISKLNEKTNTKGRVGLLQFYHQWEMER